MSDILIELKNRHPCMIDMDGVRPWPSATAAGAHVIIDLGERNEAIAEIGRLRAAIAQIHGFASVMDENNWRDLRLHIERQCNARGAFEPAENERLVAALAALLNEFSKSNDYRPDSTVVRNVWAALRSGHEQRSAKGEERDGT